LRAARPCRGDRSAASHRPDQDCGDGGRARHHEGKFWGAWRVAREADINAGGSLTLVTGYLSVRPRPNAAIVGAANGALESLARSLALELAPVRVNAVSPGIIDTPIRAAMPEQARKEMLEKTAASLPVGRVGVGEDIARQILAFMTIGFMTGAIVYLDGGALVT
jgi:NAD(P)-dependent dehydrogenase (short-subunit alcohol dehydrogenase family)